MAVLDFTILEKVAGGSSVKKLGLDLDKLKLQLDRFKGKRVLIDVKVADNGAIAKINGVSTAATRAGRSAAAAHKGGITSLSGGLVKLGGVTLAAAGYLGVKAVKSAGDFQEQLTRLTTSAGESSKNIGMVSHGILQMAGQVGDSAQVLATGLYTINSAGFHGAAGLTVLRAAAEGAKAENADLGTVANAVTDILTDYHLKAGDAATVTSKLVETTAQGKVTFQDLSAAMSDVIPLASAAHLKLSDVLGSLAEMTSHGIPAAQAAQNMANAIRSLSNPSTVMTNELAQIGLRSDDVSHKLGQRGLAGTMIMIEEAIMKHMGPAGTVLLKTFNQSQIAAEDAQKMFAALPAPLQKVAREYEQGKISSHEWTLGLRQLSAPQASLLKQWANMQNQSKGFNTALKSGSPAAQSFTQALAKATGNATSMNVALALTGKNTVDTRNKIKNIAAATQEAGHNVKGWHDIQQNFNQKLAQTRSAFGALIISIGQSLLPIVTKMAGAFANFFEDLETHQGTVRLVLITMTSIGGAFVLAAGAIKAYTLATRIASAAQIVWIALTKGMKEAQIALNLAEEANPMVLIITGIIIVVAALTVAIIALVRNWKTVWAAIKSAASTLARWFRDVFAQAFIEAWQTVSRSFVNAYHSVTAWISNTRASIQGHWNAAVAFVVTKAAQLWRSVTNWFRNIRNSVTDWISNTRASIQGHFNAAVAFVVTKAGQLWRSVTNWFKDIRNSVTDWVSNTRASAIAKWNDLVNGVVNRVSGLWRSVTGWFSRIRNDVTAWVSRTVSGVVGLFTNLRDRVAGVADNIWKHTVQAFTNMKNGLVSVFRTIANKVFVDPINFVINTVVDRGINGLISNLGKVFGQHWSVNVKPIHPFATGGVVPGSGNSDSVLAMLTPGEGVIRKDRMQELGGKKAIDAINNGSSGPAYNKGGVIPAYGLGGLIGDIGDAIGSAARTIGHGISSALHFVRGQAANGVQAILNHTIYPLANKVSKPGILGQLPNEVTHKIGNGLVDFIRGQDQKANQAVAGGMIRFRGGAGVAQWAPLILRALAALHQSAGWLGTVERRMNQESGGNPNAINRTDINAQRGDPSRGLMQTIMSTFQAYKPRGATNIYDPYSNIYAGLNYALHRYGSLSALNRPGGYANGGLFTSPTLGVIGESGTELLLPLTRRGQVRNLMQRAGLNNSMGEIHNHHYHLQIVAKKVDVDDLEKAFREMEARDGAAI